ncbi:hypothetical protein M222_1449 [Enterococcus faecalis AZ19]|uniref:hypothetical protein n=1 Tax=Enterococcus faecalis TaxID=1351 RepID=UPI00045B35E4|nr:hypothetical protein [Enterococcus faecalis]KAJ74458.1 hypothetical protein M222_1449 [Enterococcus faecalis AZ19]
MNVDEIIGKVKKLIGEGNLEKAKEFVEMHKDDLGDQYQKVVSMLVAQDTEMQPRSLVDKIKNLFK